MDNEDFKHVMLALFKASNLTHTSNGKKFIVDIRDVSDILKGFVINPSKIVFDTETCEMRTET